MPTSPFSIPMLPNKFRWIFSLTVLGFSLLFCSTPTSVPPTSIPPTASPFSTATPFPTLPLTFTPSPTQTSTSTPIPTLTETQTQTPTQTPTETPTPTDTLTPTPDVPQGIVNVAQAFCRYGPGTAYLFSFQLNQNDHVQIDGRNYAATWLWVQPDNLDRHCWSAASNFDLIGDPKEAPVVWHTLPKSSFVNPPTGVEASRDGNMVTIDWDSAYYIPVEDRRGYLLEVYVCQNGVYFWMALQTDNTSITIQDDQNCNQPSSGLIFIAEKHGYSDPVTILWP